MSQTKKLEIEVIHYQSIEDLPKIYTNLLLEARNAASHSYSPYSRYEVGAAVLLQNDIIVPGSNQENSSYPTGLCAERVALFAAATQHPGIKVRAIAITARKAGNVQFEAVTPCGSCRQVMCEYEDLHQEDITVIMEAGNGEVNIVKNAGSLLPLKFSHANLK